MFHDFTARHWMSLHGLVVALGLVVYVTASHVRKQRRHPAAAVAWVLSLFLMPYLALPLYLLFGSRKVVRGVRHPPSGLAYAGPPDGAAVRTQRLAAAMNLPRVVPYRELAIHEDGQAALEALRAVMLGATRTLDLCTFLLGRDALGDEVVAILSRRAREGVKVRLLIDGVGIYLGGRTDLRALSAAGVQVARFVPPLRSPLPGRTNLRNHRKMVIRDGQRAWCGGRNLAAEYFVGDPTAGKEAWTDLSFDFDGDLARQTQSRFNSDWAFATQAPPSDAAAPVLEDIDRGAMGAQLVPSGPDQSDDTFYSLLISSCFTAQTRILAVTPYFVPDSTLLMSLTLAVRRGVAVDLVVPRRSNHLLADLARPAALRELAAAGARVWLVPGMVHAKAVVIDDDLALAGSANLDERSLFLNYELMIAFYQPADIRRFALWIERQRAPASLFRGVPASLPREFLEGLMRWLVFQL